MKAYRGSTVWKVNSQLYALGKESVCLLNRRLGWLQSRSGFFFAPTGIWALEFWGCGIVTIVSTYSSSWPMCRSTGCKVFGFVCWVCGSEQFNFIMTLMCSGLLFTCQSSKTSSKKILLFIAGACCCEVLISVVIHSEM